LQYSQKQLNQAGKDLDKELLENSSEKDSDDSPRHSNNKPALRDNKMVDVQMFDETPTIF
jgi:hypothetical protein